MKEKYCVITFHITQHALAFEKKLLDLGVEVKLMPVPRQVSSSCGVAAKIDCSLKSQVLEFSREQNLEIENFYEIERPQKKSWFGR